MRLVRPFVVLADELHFGRAARRLGQSQPTLTQQIKRLEQQLGVGLFDRDRHGVRLTPAGEAALPSARRALRSVERMHREAVHADAERPSARGRN